MHTNIVRIVRLASLAALAPCGALAQVSFIPLGDLSGGAADSRSRCISPEGSLIVGSSSSANGTEAFRGFYGGMPAALGDLPGGTFSSESLGVSFFGGVVVGFGNTAAGREAFRWTFDEGMQPLGALPANASDSVAYAVDFNGAVIVGQYQQNFTGAPPPLPSIRAFRWTAATGIQPLPLAPNFSSGAASTGSARAVSSDGSVIVGYGSDAAFSYRPFRWTMATGTVDIGGALASAQAHGCSPDGSVVVGRTIGAPNQAFMWTQAGGAQLLGLLPGHTTSAAFDASFDGGERICGAQILAGGGTTACIWDRNLVAGGVLATGWRSVKDILVAAGINMTGWTLTQALSMCDDGQIIVGLGTDPSGNPQGWAAFIGIPTPPCPGDFNHDGARTVQDIFDFLGAYFSNNLDADINNSGAVSVQDIFDFLDAYFRGC